MDSYEHEPVYDAGYDSYHPDPYLDGSGGGSGFGGFGKEHGFEPGFVAQDLRRSGNRGRPGTRKDRPRKLDFNSGEQDFKDTQHSESDFGLDELKAFGFGLRV